MHAIRPPSIACAHTMTAGRHHTEVAPLPRIYGPAIPRQGGCKGKMQIPTLTGTLPEALALKLISLLGPGAGLAPPAAAEPCWPGPDPCCFCFCWVLRLVWAPRMPLMAPMAASKAAKLPRSGLACTFTPRMRSWPLLSVLGHIVGYCLQRLQLLLGESGTSGCILCLLTCCGCMHVT
jgi:hypothetical protein